MCNCFPQVHDVLKVIHDKATGRFHAIKQVGLRAVFAKFMIFAHILLACRDPETGSLAPLACLDRAAREGIATFIQEKLQTKVREDFTITEKAELMPV